MTNFRTLGPVACILFAAWTQTAIAHTDIEVQLADLNQKLERNPHDSSLYLIRGELKRHKRDWLGAEADFVQAYQLGSPEIRSELNLYRGRLFKEAGQSRRAVAELDYFIERNPEHIDALRMRALAYAQMGGFNEAIADYTRLIAVSPSRSPEVWLERARLCIRNDDIDAAVQSIDDAIGIFGPLVNLVEFSVNAEIGRHNHAAALNQIEKLPLILAETPEWLWRRAELFEKLDRPNDAAQLSARAHDTISKMPLNRQNSAAMQELLGKLAVLDEQ